MEPGSYTISFTEPHYVLITEVIVKRKTKKLLMFYKIANFLF